MVCIDLRNIIGLTEHLTSAHIRSHSGALVGDTAIAKGDKGSHFYDFFTQHVYVQYMEWQ